MVRNEAPPSDDEIGSDHGPDSQTVVTEWESDESPGARVVDALAAVTGKSPTQLRPLYEVIDPDALDRFLDDAPIAPDRSPDRAVSFRYEGCTVTVRGDGRILVSLPDDDH